MDIKIETTNQKLNDISTKIGFRDSHFNQYDSYSYVCRLTLHDKRKRVGFISVTLFNIQEMENSGIDIGIVSDLYDSDTHSAIYRLTESSIAEETNDNNVFKKPFIAYIKRFYIEPDYRQKRIGNWLIKNLQDILLYSINVDVRAFVIVPSPETPTADYNSWQDDSDKPYYNELKSVMIKMLEKNGFSDLGDGCFGVNVML